MTMKTADVARRQIDARMVRIGSLRHEHRPTRGWIRAIRDALGMSTTDLGRRMGIAQTRVSVIERSEAAGAIKLDTLSRAADALDCELVYFFIPRTSLEEAVQTQGRKKAADHLRRVAHSMRLEDQAVEGSDSQIEDLASEFTDRRGLWADNPK